MTQVQQDLLPERAAMLKILREHGSVPGGLVRQACAWAVNEIDVQARAYRELADENSALQMDISTRHSREIDRLRAINAKLLATAGALVDNHLRHDADCSINHPYYPPRGFERRPCGCGLDASLVAYRAALAAQQHDPEQQPDSDARDEVEK